MRTRQQVDLAMYPRAALELVRHPSILLLPFIAAVIDVTVSTMSRSMTDPLGGFGQGIFVFFIQIIYGFAFGIAIVQANNVWRNYRGSFDAAWEEGRRKGGGIIFATVMFWFVLYAAAYIGTILGPLSVLLEVVAAVFMIYVIPAAAIGGLPGGMALSGSIRAVRAQPVGAVVLALVFAVLFWGVPQLLVNLAGAGYLNALGVIGFELIRALVTALILAYLAFPFAKSYDDVAFRNLY